MQQSKPTGVESLLFESKPSKRRPRLKYLAACSETMISRRDFLKEASFATAAVGLIHPVLNWVADQDGVPALPGKEGMIVRSFRFLDLEMPTEFVVAHKELRHRCNPGVHEIKTAAQAIDS